MSLLGWLGGAPTTRSLHQRIVLGVIGTRSNIRHDELYGHILAPVIEAWGMPDEIILPAEGDSSEAIRQWARMKDIPVFLIGCDWAKHGRRAGILRDSRIQLDASHMLLLQGPRSNALSSLAARLDRKGRPVAISERPGMPPQPAHKKDYN